MEFIFEKINYVKGFQILQETELGRSWLHIIKRDFLFLKKAIKYFKTDNSELAKIGLSVCYLLTSQPGSILHCFPNNHIALFYTGYFILKSDRISNMIKKYRCPINIGYNYITDIEIDTNNISAAIPYLIKSATLGNSWACNLLYQINKTEDNLIISIKKGFYPNLDHLHGETLRNFAANINDIIKPENISEMIKYYLGISFSDESNEKNLLLL